MTTEVEEALFDREEIEHMLSQINFRVSDGYTVGLTMGKAHGKRAARIEVRIADDDEPENPRLLEDFGTEEEDALKAFLLGMGAGVLYGRTRR